MTRAKSKRIMNHCKMSVYFSVVQNSIVILAIKFSPVHIRIIKLGLFYTCKKNKKKRKIMKWPWAAFAK